MTYLLPRRIMLYVLIGALGFPIFHLVDIAAIKRIAWAKPLAWMLGTALLASGMVLVCLSPDKFALPIWAIACGWILLTASIFQLLYSLFINLPFYKTYFRVGVSDELVTSGLYAIVRHPGVYGLGIMLFSLVLISQSRLMLDAALVWMAIDIVVVVIQDRFFFEHMFGGYAGYRKNTPMLIPSWQSLARYATDITLKSLTRGGTSQ